MLCVIGGCIVDLYVTQHVSCVSIIGAVISLWQNKDMELSMENGYVLLKLQGSVWKSAKQYQDGEWHYLTVSGQGQR